MARVSSRDELFDVLKKARKKNKYNANSCRCINDHSHDSRDEARYCEQMHIEMKAGHYKSIDRARQFELRVNDNRICLHQPDWFVVYPDGSEGIVEYKGFATREWDIKRKLFEALYPELTYVVKTKKDLWR